jgi:mannose-6-phosphate isomerase
VKVLAADEPLSLQAHPSAEQAVEGFAREDKLGIPVNSPIRNYRDRSHKPELLVGARAPSRRLPVSGRRQHRRIDARACGHDLDPFVNLLAGQSDADGLRALFTTWITAPQPDLDVLVPAVIEGRSTTSGRAEGVRGRGKDRARARRALPGDAGVLASLLLNRISLQPGEAIYLPAGNLHTYLHGVASR